MFSGFFKLTLNSCNDRPCCLSVGMGDKSYTSDLPSVIINDVNKVKNIDAQHKVGTEKYIYSMQDVGKDHYFGHS